MDQMSSIAPGAIAGVIAALTATAILGIARYVRRFAARRQDIRAIREILLVGKKRVLESKDTCNTNMHTTIPGNVLRAAQYNNMIKQLSIALEKWPANLRYNQRKEILEALDWYKTDNLIATKNATGQVTFVELPEGKWPTGDMKLEFAENKFNRLQSIKWLHLNDEGRSRPLRMICNLVKYCRP